MEQRESEKTPIDLRVRTKQFALRVIRLNRALPRSMEAHVIGRQLLRSGTSVGANYREATRARSQDEYASKLGVCLQELEETTYWLELVVEAELVKIGRVQGLFDEIDELLAIFVGLAKRAGSKQRVSGKS